MRKQRRSGTFLCFLAVSVLMFLLCSFASAHSFAVLHAVNHSVVSTAVAESPPAAVLDEMNTVNVTMIEAANDPAGATEVKAAYVVGTTSVENLARHGLVINYHGSARARKRGTARANTKLGFV